MQYIKDLPQTTQIALAAILVLLPLLVGLSVRRRRVLAAKPADEATRKERRRRKNRHAGPDGAKPARRRRRRLADEGARSMGEAGSGEDASEVVVAVATEPAAMPDTQEALTPVDADGDIVIPAATPTPAPEPVHEVAPQDDPYVVTQPLMQVSASAVAQPGWPSPGELASGFDPDAFDPLPPEEEMAHDGPDANAPVGGDAVGDAEAWLEDDLALETAPVTAPIALTADADDAEAPSWDDDTQFDPATGWADDESETDPQPAWSANDATAVSDLDDDELDGPHAADLDADELDGALDADLDAWDDTDELMSLPEPAAAAPPAAPADDVAWDTPDDDEDEILSATAITPDTDVAVTWDGAADAALTWGDDDWDDDETADDQLAVPFPAPGTLPAHPTTAADLAVPFPAPGTLPDHADTAAALLAGPLVGTEPDVTSPDTADAAPVSAAAAPESPVTTPTTTPTTTSTDSIAISALMPSLTGRIDAGAGSPVVIDLANLVAHGERVEVIIEQDEHGNGIRLRFGAGAGPVADAQAPADSAAPDGAPVVVEPSAPDDGVAEPASEEAPSLLEEPTPTPVDTTVVDVPFLTGGPREVDEAGWQPVDPPAANGTQPDEHLADEAYAPVEPEPMASPLAQDPEQRDEPVAIGVGSLDAALATGDPATILAEIRARLAALDAHRHGDDGGF